MVVPVALTITALVVAIVALVLYILQMILGSPKIKLDFDVLELESSSSLNCRIKNEPIVTGLPHLLRIRRATAEVTGILTIREQGSNILVFGSIFPSLITHTGVKNFPPIILAASGIPVTLVIVEALYASHKVKVFGQKVALGHGAYWVNVEVRANGESITKRANFVVSDKHPFAYWS